jgi:predicted transposase YbfD/YdcC
MKRNAATPKGIERRLDDAHFAKVNDPRRSGSVTYKLPALLNALVAAIVTGARSLRQVEQRSLQIVKKLGPWKGLTKRIADNTFSTLLPRLALAELMSCLHRMVKAEHRRGNLKPTRLPMGAVAIDGKHVATLHWHDLCRVLELSDDVHGSPPLPTAELVEQVCALLAERYPEAQLCVPGHMAPYALMRVHTVTLVSSEAAVCIHQRPIEGETNEIGAMPALLSELGGAYRRTRLFELVTTDAGNTSVKVAKQLRQMRCHYCCQIKSIHGDLHTEAVRALGRRSKAQARAHYTDTQNGEVVRYYLWRVELGEQGWLDWRHARQLVRVQRIAEHPDIGERSVGNRYYVLSQPSDALGPRTTLDVSRAHWRCENNTHWTADAELMEDRRRQAWSRHPRGVLVASVLRMLALHILAVTRQLSRLPYSREQLSWSDVIQHYQLRLCESILETEAFDNV